MCAKGLWQVFDVELVLSAEEETVHVKQEESAMQCCYPIFGDVSPGYDSRWRHPDACQYKTILVADVLMVECRANFGLLL